MKIFNLAEIKDKTIIIDGKEYNIKKGKHAIWIPDLEAKIIWTFNGKIESYSAWERGRNKSAIESFTFNDKKDNESNFDNNTLNSVINEYQLMKYFGEIGITPPVGEFFYIKSIISDFFPNTQHCDPIGVYGYFIKDANKLSKGSYSLDKIQELVKNKTISASKGALGDIKKEDNIINGYLIDIRRTLWDMVKFNNLDVGMINEIFYKENGEELQEKIKNLSQFPHKERKQKI
jgi:hypothetical protein